MFTTWITLPPVFVLLLSLQQGIPPAGTVLNLSPHSCHGFKAIDADGAGMKSPAHVLAELRLQAGRRE